MKNNNDKLKRKILMIDDDISVIRSIELMLSLEDIHTDYFIEPDIFLKEIDNIKFDSYDLIICDYKMPEVNGVFIYDELIKRVSNDVLPNYKILYTGNKGQLSICETKQMEKNGISIFLKGSTDLDYLLESIYSL